MRNTTTRRSLLSILLPGIALVLSVCTGMVGAQGLSLRVADWTTVALIPRGDEALAAATIEVATTAGNVLAPAALPPGLDGRTIRDVAGISYRVWVSGGRADVGLGLGSLGFVVRPVAGRSGDALTLAGARPAVSLGVRYRLTDQHLLLSDASHVRGLGAGPAADYVSTQVGLEWRPAKATLGFEHGALGMQLDSGYRVSVKPRGGGVAVYLRGQF
jgi:hypothetical protein